MGYPKEKIFKVDDLVTHLSYGPGKIVQDVSNQYTNAYEVQFKHGIKRTCSEGLLVSRPSDSILGNVCEGFGNANGMDGGCHYCREDNEILFEACYKETSVSMKKRRINSMSSIDRVKEDLNKFHEMLEEGYDHYNMSEFAERAYSIAAEMTLKYHEIVEAAKTFVQANQGSNSQYHEIKEAFERLKKSINNERSASND